jgi:hypothetical protein
MYMYMNARLVRSRWLSERREVPFVWMDGWMLDATLE